MNNGILYGIGVGPGAPDLITLRAVNALARVDAILAAASPKNDDSAALAIAKPHLNPAANILRLDFPMTRDNASLQKAWQTTASTTMQVLATGKNAAFLTLGDPLIYSTFAYLLRAVLKLAPATPVQIIPGITSFQAAAAQTGISLCEGEESFTLISGIAGEEEIENLLRNPGPAAILKVYSNYQAIARALKTAKRECVQVSFVERAGEEIRRGAPDKKPPYMTLVLCPARNKPE